MEKNKRELQGYQVRQMSKTYFLGIDIGTQGARVLLLDETGQQLAAKEESFPFTESLREEQSPALWWDSCCRIIPALISQVKNQININQVKAASVTSTSGTIIPVDHDYNPLHPAIMYSDSRSGPEAAFCREIAKNEINSGFTAFSPSCGLPKMRWFLNHFPDRASKLFKFIHASDFITGRLCGAYAITDFTNAMKSGYDLHRYEWPGYIAEKIGIRQDWLQQVRPSGEPLGTLRPDLAAEWGLPQSLIVTTGMTDGCASQVASGAVNPGQWNTTIGTTLVIKGVTREEIIDPSGVIYNHRHPSGLWMPGGASNTGADWVNSFFSAEDLDKLSQLAAERLPAKSVAWPLLQKGERFPFVAPEAFGFWPEDDKVEKFTACLEGVAFIERYAYERIASLSDEKPERIFSAGGGSNNDTWLRIRSNVIGLPVCKMKNVSGAAGAAILAASRSFYSSLSETAAAMVAPELEIHPDPGLASAYNKKYQFFLEELRKRKILK